MIQTTRHPVKRQELDPVQILQESGLAPHVLVASLYHRRIVVTVPPDRAELCTVLAGATRDVTGWSVEVWSFAE